MSHAEYRVTFRYDQTRSSLTFTSLGAVSAWLDCKTTDQWRRTEIDRVEIRTVSEWETVEWNAFDEAAITKAEGRS